MIALSQRTVPQYSISIVVNGPKKSDIDSRLFVGETKREVLRDSERFFSQLSNEENSKEVKRAKWQA